MDAKIRSRLVSGMNIAAGEAELRAADPRFDAAGRHHATGDAMLAPFEIDHVPRPEFGEPEKPRAVYRVRLGGPGHQRADRKAREIVARYESLIGKVTISVKIGFGAVRAVGQQLDFPPRFALELLGGFLLPAVAQPRIVDDAPRGVALLTGGAVEFAPAVEGLVERLRSPARHPLDPYLRIPWGACDLGLGRSRDGVEGFANLG